LLLINSHLQLFINIIKESITVITHYIRKIKEKLKIIKIK